MRRFTPDEANSVLPEVRELAEAIRSCSERVASRRDELAHIARPNGHLERDDELLAAIEVYRANVRRLQGLGVVLRDPSSGLVDFPARVNGEDGFLCWRLGEVEVGWWHPADAGVAGRRPISEADRFDR